MQATSSHPPSSHQVCRVKAKGNKSPPKPLAKKAKRDAGEESIGVTGPSTHGKVPFKRVSFDSEAARKRKPKSIKQILEQMAMRYGSDAHYQAFNWTSVLAAPSVRPRRKYCDVTGLVVS